MATTWDKKSNGAIVLFAGSGIFWIASIATAAIADTANSTTAAAYNAAITIATTTTTHIATSPTNTAIIAYNIIVFLQMLDLKQSCIYILS